MWDLSTESNPDLICKSCLTDRRAFKFAAKDYVAQ